MSFRRHGALVACVLLCTAAASQACVLALAEHRSEKPLLRVLLDAERPAAQIAFSHSVLGTPVVDHYEWRPDKDGHWRAHLVEEYFEGEGYGLPNAAGPGETLTREGKGWRLRLDRVVDPLVVLPLPSQSMRVQVSHRATVLLGSLSDKSVRMRVEDCQRQKER